MVTKKELREMNREMIAELQKTPEGRKELVGFMQTGCFAMLLKVACLVFIIWLGAWAFSHIMDSVAKTYSVIRSQEHSEPLQPLPPQHPISEQP